MKILALALLIAAPALADSPPSVLVTTIAPRQATRPERITAYGSARPALDAATTLSQQLDGQVAAIAVTPGETVSAGQNLLTFRLSAAAVSLYRQAVTALDVAVGARTHAAQLLGQHLATRDQLAAADKSVTDARSALDALRREGGGLASVTVTAPFDAIIDAIPIAQGARLPPGTPLLTLTARNGLVVTVGIDPASRATVHEGEAVTLTRLSGGHSLEGQVRRVDGVLNPRTRLVDIDISVPPDQILSGEAFRADVTVGTVSGWLVAHDAIATDDKSAWIFQAADGKAHLVPVTVALALGNTDIVSGPLDPTRPIIVDGAYQLTDGMAIRPHS